MIRNKSNLKDLLKKSEEYSKKTEISKNEYMKNLEKHKKYSEKFKKNLELYICNLVDFEHNYIWSDDTIKDIIIKREKGNIVCKKVGVCQKNITISHVADFYRLGQRISLYSNFRNCW